jgi:hypothetical protein
MSKPAGEWTADDAREVLARSPWSRSVVSGIAPMVSEDKRREGGDMGTPKGVGYDGLEDARAPLPSLGNMLKGEPATNERRHNFVKLQVRWENALPIRVAELKAGAPEPPTLSSDGYRIAVYGVPPTSSQADPVKLGKPLKADAVLKCAGKETVHPSRVEVFQTEDGLVIVYLFPYSMGLNQRDHAVEFDASIGRLHVTTSFNLEEMEYQGKLEL